MPRRPKRKPYRIIGAYDSETCNINDGMVMAYPVSHQLGLLSCQIQDVTPDNVEQVCNVAIYRHAIDLYTRLDELASMQADYVPVIVCHNLAFDMYGLSPWLLTHECKALAKSQRKPITITVLDESGKPALVIWDTLGFSQQPLARMGENAGYRKAVGEWDYNLIRTPYTPLTAQEMEYAKADIYSLLTWLSWWLARNPEIEPETLGLNCVTKTGVVRQRRKLRYYKLGGGKYNVGKQWMRLNLQQAPKTDDELFTMQAATRGGFTFCAANFASVPFELDGTDMVIAAYDATSQHPAQMVSHRYPTNFHETTPKVLELAFDAIASVSMQTILERWSKPFIRGLYAAFEFENLRPKPGSVFERWGIYPLASARFESNANTELNEDNQDAQEQEDKRRDRGYADSVVNPTFAFGKLVKADKCTLYLTELGVWEVSQAYIWDSMRPVHGYLAGRFVRPSDMAVISVMQFYQAKNAYKAARGEYLKTGKLEHGHNLETLGIAPAIVEDMRHGTLSQTELEAEYLRLKADLNALFGIEASNEYRRDTVLTENGIEYTGDIGLCNAPEHPKAWYQFGQRIVGWSRIAQICVMQLLEPYIAGVINGDTDSVKVLTTEDKLPEIDMALGRLARAIDRGKTDNCARVKRLFKPQYDPLDGIGHYVQEYTEKRFCAAWNKAYCTQDENGRFSYTLAGVPTSDIYGKNGRGELELLQMRVNGFADKLYAQGRTFAEICDLLLGYNVTYSPDLTGLNARKIPEWGDIAHIRVTDYLGNTYQVTEPKALALYPMPKTIGASHHKENLINMGYALNNRPSVNIDTAVITSAGIMKGGKYEQIL